MRVIFIGPFAWAPKGTVSARAFLVGQALAERGHEVLILMAPYDNPRDSGFEWMRDGVRLVNMRLPSWGDGAKARLTVPLAMARHAADAKPDVIHVFKPIGYAGLTGLWLRLFWPKLPVVLDNDDWEGRGGWADIKGYPRLWWRFFDWQEGWLARRANAVTVASRALETRMWSLGLCPEVVHYLPNGPSRIFRKRIISEDDVHTIRTMLGVGDAPLAAYVGQISYGSEVDLVLEALPTALETIPELRVVIVGGGDGVPVLRNTVCRSGLAAHVLFTGWLDENKTMDILAASDLALYPYRDSLINRAKSPSKITAYMAMGKAIVASAVGEIVEYLEGGRAGLLVDPGDAQAFAAGMVALLQDDRRAAKLGQRARQRIWGRYDWVRQVERVEDVYRKVTVRSIQ
jgi:glycosyltransferase involved in cell wall biosynthesis